MLPILILFAGYFIYMMSRRKKLENQVELFNKLLYVEKSPQKYIAEVDKLLLKFQTENERNINYIQKTTGLLYAGRFDEAVSILNEKVKKIPPNWQAVYYHNMLLSLYFRGDTEKANEILKEVKSTIDSYYKKDYNKVTIELIYAVSDYYNNRISECKEFFKLLPEITKNEYRIAMGYYFSGKILQIEGKAEEGEECLNKAKTHGHGSFIEFL
jgi:tetratricopeptide (TPR) repeat protein